MSRGDVEAKAEIARYADTLSRTYTDPRARKGFRKIRDRKIKDYQDMLEDRRCQRNTST